MNELILIAEDEHDIQALLDYNLQQDGFKTHLVSRGDQVVEAVRKFKPSLVLLDLMMPGMSGIEACKRLRADAETSSVPIIMVTARASEGDKLVGLEIGADDYVTKPFSPREVVARVRAVLRRADATHSHGDVVTVGDSMELDVPRMETSIDGRRVELTATEFQLLLHMARQPGRVFTRTQLLDAVHGVAVESYERAIDAHVKNIRRKIEQDPHAPRRLQTVFGVGYRLADSS